VKHNRAETYLRLGVASNAPGPPQPRTASRQSDAPHAPAVKYRNAGAETNPAFSGMAMLSNAGTQERAILRQILATLETKAAK
jgi:hypothetical protein